MVGPSVRVQGVDLFEAKRSVSGGWTELVGLFERSDGGSVELTLPTGYNKHFQRTGALSYVEIVGSATSSCPISAKSRI